MRVLMVSMLIVLGLFGISDAASPEPSFDDPMFQRCVTWMMGGERGALIDNVCLDEYQIPPPSLFICARKVRTGFLSSTDQEGCAIIFEEQAKKVRAGFVR
jgi:hypothetical protein